VERTFWFHFGDPLGLSLLGILLLSEATEGLFRGLSFFLLSIFIKKLFTTTGGFYFATFSTKVAQNLSPE
jgi:hypothetical protein